MTPQTFKKNIKDIIKNYIAATYDENDWTGNELLYSLPMGSIPMVQEDEGSEPLDFENGGILNINTDTFTILVVAGGDWQQPIRFSLTMRDDGIFYYNNDGEPDPSYDDANLLTREDILKELE